MEKKTRKFTFAPTAGHIGPPFPEIGLFDRVDPLRSAERVRASLRYGSQLGTEYLFPIQVDGHQLPNEPLISVSLSKKVIETALNRGDRVGNVLEEINLNNYRVRIRGRVLGDGGFPFSELSKLRETVEKKGSLEVRCELLAIYNITRLVVVSASFPGTAGQGESQSYELECISDEDFELDYLNDNN